MTETAVFVFCIEKGEIQEQALLLIRSIRAFAGRHRDAEILAVSPRKGGGIDRAARKTLEDLRVTYHEALLNTACPDYGSANRVYAAAWAADNTTATTLVVLDSDTLFLGEPELLGPDTDVKVRPVDTKGCTTEGPDDRLQPYWEALCGLAKYPIDRLPFVETTVSKHTVRASYNGGYSVIRRSTGIMQRTADLFTRSVQADLRPYKGSAPRQLFASTGLVPQLAREYWGSSQAAFSISAWSVTPRIRTLDARYNVPLHLLALPAHWRPEWMAIGPVHVHYHWMLREEHRGRTLDLLGSLGVPADRVDWIAAHTPIRL